MKTVLVTGDKGLLGKVFSRAFEKAGYGVVGYDLPEMDVTIGWHWQMAAACHPDVLINCAGITNNSKQTGYDGIWGAWDSIMNVNLTGTGLGCMIVGQQMVEHGGGCIINLASQYGIVSPRHDIYSGTGIHQPLAYSVSKAGVIQMTKYLACLWGKHNVRVNALAPGGVYNGQDEEFVKRFSNHNPMERMARPEEMADAALWLAHNTYVNGHVLAVDGGWTAQ